MHAYLLKLTGFVGLQAILFLLVQAIAAVPSGPLVDVHDQALRTTLANELFYDWRADATLLATAQQAGPRDPRIERVFEHFRQADDHYLASLGDKEHRLRTTLGRRLIIVGGSNVAFGIDSVLLRERYGLEPVNLGVHGGLGGLYLLKQTSAHVRRGDVVLVCFEYRTLRSGMHPCRSVLTDQACSLVSSVRPYFGTEEDRVDLTAAVVSNDLLPTANHALSWKEYSDKRALSDLCTQVRDRFGRGAERCHWWFSTLTDGRDSMTAQREHFEREFAQAAPQIVQHYHDWNHAIYMRSKFNYFGDMVAHHDQSSSHPIKPVNSLPLNAQESDAVENSIAVLNRYAARWRSAGADVYFAYPPLHQPSGEFPQQLEALVAAKLNIPVLFPLAQATTPAEELFDTENHLNWTGICRRMQILTTALDRHLPPCVVTSPAQHVAQRKASQHLSLTSTAQGQPSQR